jgi:hypothetical protein
MDEKFKFGSGRKITVLSAGTLCGGMRSLPHGSDRSYNILQLDTETLNATVHQRRMVNEDFTSPIWAAGCYAVNQQSYVELTIQPPQDPVSAFSRLAEAETLLSKNDNEGAKRMLLPLAKTNTLARRLLLECYANTSCDADFLMLFNPPTSAGEAVLLADAFWEQGQRDRLAALVQSPFIQNSTDPAMVALRTKYTMRLRIK